MTNNQMTLVAVYDRLERIEDVCIELENAGHLTPEAQRIYIELAQLLDDVLDCLSELEIEQLHFVKQGQPMSCP